MAMADREPQQLVVFLKRVFIRGSDGPQHLASPTPPQCYTEKERKVAAHWGTP